MITHRIALGDDPIGLEPADVGPLAARRVECPRSPAERLVSCLRAKHKIEPIAAQLVGRPFRIHLPDLDVLVEAGDVPDEIEMERTGASHFDRRLRRVAERRSNGSRLGAAFSACRRAAGCSRCR